MIPKFRAWHSELGRMMSIKNMWFQDSCLEELELNDSVMNDYITAYPDEIKLMQSTSLKDKNDKEIFEGDILKFNDEWEDYCQEGYVDGSSEGINYVLIGSEMTYFIFEKTKYPDSSLFYYVNEEHLTFQEVMEDDEFEFEVIGNIYENPELLEVDDE